MLQIHDRSARGRCEPGHSVTALLTKQSFAKSSVRKRDRSTHIVGRGVGNNVVQSIRLRDILARLSDDDSKFDLIVR